MFNSSLQISQWVYKAEQLYFLAIYGRTISGLPTKINKSDPLFCRFFYKSATDSIKNLERWPLILDIPNEVVLFVNLLSKQKIWQTFSLFIYNFTKNFKHHCVLKIMPHDHEFLNQSSYTRP
jgi:hypothetical protein